MANQRDEEAQRAFDFAAAMMKLPESARERIWHMMEGIKLLSEAEQEKSA